MKSKNKKTETKKFAWLKPYAIRDVIITFCVLMFGLLFKTNHMVYISRGIPFRWLFANSTDTHINILRFGVDFLIVLAIVIICEFIWEFVKINIEANCELKKRGK